jgi:cytochrome b6-f complex iron-sulfur subunit
MSVKSPALSIVHSPCSRRALLQGLGVAALGSLVIGCGASGVSPAAATSTMCSATTVCISLTDAANRDLTTVGGAMMVDTSNDSIMVIRNAATTVVAISALCTHAGCGLNYDAGGKQLVCPCHNSVFTETGAVTQGPARQPLQVYVATLTADTITITV